MATVDLADLRVKIDASDADTAVAKLRALDRAISNYARSASGSLSSAGASWDAAANRWRNANGQFTAAGRAAQQGFANVAADAARASAGMLKSSVDAAEGFQALVQKTINNTTIGTKGFGDMATATRELGNGIQQIAAQTGAPLDQLAAGYAHVANFGFTKASDALAILTTATRSAVSTNADAGKTAEALANIMHEYSIPVGQAANAMDVLHLAASQGNMTLEQFVDTSGKAVAMAANTHVPLNEVAADLAAMTRHGITAASASTMFAGSVSKIINPSASARTELERLHQLTGIDLPGDFSSAGLASKGYVGIMNDLMAATHGNADEIYKLIPATRGGLAALINLGTGAKDYHDILGSLNDTMAGKTAPTMEAYQAYLKTAAGQHAILSQNVQNLEIALGTGLVPVVTKVTAAIIPVIKGITDWANAHPKLADALLGATAALGGMSSGILGLRLAFGPLIPLIGALSVPVVALIAAGVGLYEAWQHDFGGIREIVAGVWAQIKPVFEALQGGVKALQAAFGQGDFTSAFKAVPGALAPAGAAVESLRTRVEAALPALVATAESAAKRLGTALVGWVEAAAPPMLAKLGDLLGQVGSWISSTAVPFLNSHLSVWAKSFSAWLDVAIPALMAKFGDLLGVIGAWLDATGIPYLRAHFAGWVKTAWQWVVEIGGPLLTAFGDLLGKLGSWMDTTAIPALRAYVAKWAPVVWEWVKEASSKLVTEMGVLLGQLGSWMDTTAVPAIKAKFAIWAPIVWAWVKDASTTLVKELGTLLGSLGTWIDTSLVPTTRTWIRKWIPVFWDWVKDASTSLVKELGTLLGAFGTWIDATAVPTIRSAIKQWGPIFWDWIQGAAKQGVTELDALATSWISDLKTIAGQLATAAEDIAKQLIAGLVQGIKDHAGDVKNAIGGLKDDVIGGLKSGFGIFSPSKVTTELGGYITQGLIDGIKGKHPDLQSGIKDLTTAVAIDSPEYLLNKTGAAIVSGLGQGISDASYDATTAVDALAKPVQAGLAGAASLLTMAGQQLVAGLVQGIRDTAGDVYMAMTDMAEQATMAAQDKLEIHSPSQVFATIGTQIGAGLVAGMASQTSAVQQAAAGMASAAATSATTAAQTSAPFVTAASGGMSSSAQAPSAGASAQQAYADNMLAHNYIENWQNNLSGGVGGAAGQVTASVQAGTAALGTAAAAAVTATKEFTKIVGNQVMTFTSQTDYQEALVAYRQQVADAKAAAKEAATEQRAAAADAAAQAKQAAADAAASTKAAAKEAADQARAAAKEAADATRQAAKDAADAKRQAAADAAQTAKDAREADTAAQRDFAQQQLQADGYTVTSMQDAAANHGKAIHDAAGNLVYMVNTAAQDHKAAMKQAADYHSQVMAEAAANHLNVMLTAAGLHTVDITGASKQHAQEIMQAARFHLAEVTKAASEVHAKLVKEAAELHHYHVVAAANQHALVMHEATVTHLNKMLEAAGLHKISIEGASKEHAQEIIQAATIHLGEVTKAANQHAATVKKAATQEHAAQVKAAAVFHSTQVKEAAAHHSMVLHQTAVDHLNKMLQAAGQHKITIEGASSRHAAEIIAAARTHLSEVTAAAREHSRIVAKEAAVQHHDQVVAAAKEHHAQVQAAAAEHHAQIKAAAAEHHAQIVATAAAHHAQVLAAALAHHEQVVATAAAHHVQILAAAKAHHEAVVEAATAHHAQVAAAAKAHHEQVLAAALKHHNAVKEAADAHKKAVKEAVDHHSMVMLQARVDHLNTMLTAAGQHKITIEGASVTHAKEIIQAAQYHYDDVVAAAKKHKELVTSGANDAARIIKAAAVEGRDALAQALKDLGSGTTVEWKDTFDSAGTLIKGSLHKIADDGSNILRTEGATKFGASATATLIEIQRAYDEGGPKVNAKVKALVDSAVAMAASGEGKWGDAGKSWVISMSNAIQDQKAAHKAVVQDFANYGALHLTNTGLPLWKASGHDSVASYIRAIKDMQPDTVRAMEDTLPLPQSVKDQLNRVLTETGGKGIDAYTRALRAGKVPVQDAATAGLHDPIASVLGTTQTTLTNAGAKASVDYAAALAAGAGKVNTGAGTMAAGMPAVLGKAGTDSGTALDSGLSSGITAGIAGVTTAINQLADAAIAAFKARLGIHSPSTVFEAMGTNTAEGYKSGLDASVASIGASAVSLVDATVNAAQARLDARRPDLVHAAASAATDLSESFAGAAPTDHIKQLAQGIVDNATESVKSAVDAAAGPLHDAGTKMVNQVCVGFVDGKPVMVDTVGQTIQAVGTAAQADGNLKPFMDAGQMAAAGFTGSFKARLANDTVIVVTDWATQLATAQQAQLQNAVAAVAANASHPNGYQPQGQYGVGNQVSPYAAAGTLYQAGPSGPAPGSLAAQAAVMRDYGTLLSAAIQQGMAQGMTSNDAFLAAIKDNNLAAQAQFQADWAIHSPSKVTAGFGSNIMQGLVVGFDDEQTKVVSHLHDLIDAHRKAHDSPQTILTDTGHQVMEGLRLAIIERAPQSLDAMKQTGHQLTQGLADGVNETQATGVNALADLARSALTAFKNLLGIHSPSTVMAEQGAAMTAGLARGLADNAAPAEAALRSLHRRLQAVNDDERRRYGAVALSVVPPSAGQLAAAQTPVQQGTGAYQSQQQQPQVIHVHLETDGQELASAVGKTVVGQDRLRTQLVSLGLR